jgi:hypothetical protein
MRAYYFRILFWGIAIIRDHDEGSLDIEVPEERNTAMLIIVDVSPRANM